MFPLIPALILLLLQGQASLERGRVPATLEGLPWAIVAQHLEADERGASKPRIAQVCALLRLLSPNREITAPVVEAAPAKPSRPSSAPIERLSAGYEEDQRSRDGPSVLI